MKTLIILLFAFAMLIFSGCYTQLLIEDNESTSDSDEPVYFPPETPTTDPIWIPLPTHPIHPVHPIGPAHPIHPDPLPPGGGIPKPTGSNDNTGTRRDTGYQRRDTNPLVPENSLRSVPSRNESSSRQETPTSSLVVVPTRGESGNQTGPAQHSTQENVVPSRSGRR